MTSVEIGFSFTPAAAYVRAARLVAADVASQSGVDPVSLEEIQQATGEACTRAILRHRHDYLTDLVHVQFSIDDQFVVKVTDNAQNVRTATLEPGDYAPTATENSSSEDLTLVVLANLVKDLEVTAGADLAGSTVRMRWPLPATVSDDDS
ncbi:ATP-binding protein [Haloglycomyces albus]|uniref:ATP-binding protein n=1 Tax=Haloglycomyces albus TaxID=526067 RepID=UPI00046CF2C6|nr:ATP-binding protein [Haloglycomyces albus]